MRAMDLFSFDGYIGSHNLMGYDDVDYASFYAEARVKDMAVAVTRFQTLVLNIGKGVNFKVTPAEERFFIAYGMHLNKKGLDRLAVEFPEGNLPLHIQVVTEGTVTRTGIPLLQIANTRKGYSWLPGMFEDYFLNAWASCSVNTQAYYGKQMIKAAMEESCMTLDKLPFMLIDFGMRACQTIEVAGVLGQGALLHFIATDNTAAVRQIMIDYSTDSIVGGTIAASAHSVMTLEDADKELPFIRKILEKFIAGNIDGTPVDGTIPGMMLALVIDSYNDKNCVQNIILRGCRDLLDQIKAQGKVLILRPDSGDATTKVIDVMNWIQEVIPEEITVNKKGYKQLPSYLATIQGDGISILTGERTLPILIANILEAKWALDNTAFGSGGALLNGMNRDSLGFAFKLSAVKRKGSDFWEGVGKLTPGKVSKRGRLALVADSKGNLDWVQEEDLNGRENKFDDIYFEGVIEAAIQTFEDARYRGDQVTLKDLGL